jgi:hypothetical protein
MFVMRILLHLLNLERPIVNLRWPLLARGYVMRTCHPYRIGILTLGMYQPWMFETEPLPEFYLVMSLVIGSHLVVLAVTIGRLHHRQLGVDNGSVRTSNNVIVIATVKCIRPLGEICNLIAMVGHRQTGVIMLIEAVLLLLIETFLVPPIGNVAEIVILLHAMMTTIAITIITVITTQVWMVIFNDYVDELETTRNYPKTA